MAFDNDRNRVLLSLRDRPDGADSPTLIEAVGLSEATIKRHLVYCVDYGLATWMRNRTSTLAVITTRGRDYLARQGF
ncbi:MAG TPA: hypothetical protein VK881_04445 [bacterium]|jgi:hypothetical protein|uniref:ArsR family transcriptional regulator n=1 Tax=Candidatus Segetimicrobium genomatis TaxID=2569760 RepID=A0A537JAK8_9BACT|nr:MAG: hypothetical protein E6H03_08280 [Terrabacteria group bacterium ANGP1]HTD46499.1 hypothetical protein [bacterium]